jgi:hypothetical protein
MSRQVVLTLCGTILLLACGDDDAKRSNLKPDASVDGCVPKVCESGGACGTVDDGCGGKISCPCSCDGGAPLSCEQLGASCGSIVDRCGNRLACGSCGPGLSCGGAGANRCGQGACAAKQCSVGQCGQVSNGCDNILDCGACPSGQECVANECKACTTPDCLQPTSCTAATYLADCPQRPCQEVAGCENSVCTFKPFECASNNACPYQECSGTPYVVGSRTYYRNECVRQDNHACVDASNKAGTCRGNACVTGERRLLEGRIEPLAGPGGTTSAVRRLLDQSLFFGSSGATTTVCAPDANRCLVGGVTTDGT